MLGRTVLKPGEILKTADIKGSKGICIASVGMKPGECALKHDKYDLLVFYSVL
jgi:hypothetical protein